MLMKLFKVVVLGLLVAAIVTSIPDIKRYLAMRAM
jgi:hypothetical protein